MGNVRKTKRRMPGIGDWMKEAETFKDKLWVAAMGKPGLKSEVARLLVLRLGEYLAQGTKEDPKLLVGLIFADPSERSVEGMAARSLIRLLGNVEIAIENRDGGFLRRLAEAIEKDNSERRAKPDMVRIYLLKNFCPREIGCGMYLPPLRDPVTMKRLLELIPNDEDGKKVSRSTLKEMCKELKISCVADKTGRPKKVAGE